MPHKCQKCNKFIRHVNDPGLCCVSCSKAFHRECANLTQQELDDLEVRESKGVVWKCIDCCKKNKRRSSAIFNSVNNNSSTSPSTSSTTTNPPPTTLKQQFVDLLKEFQLLKSSTTSEIDLLKQEIIQLKGPLTPSVVTPSATLPQQIITPQSPADPVTLTEDSLEIRGLPVELIRSPHDTIAAVAVAIGCPLNHSEVSCTSSTDKTLIDIKFTCPRKRSDFLSAGKTFNRNKGRLNILQRQFKFFVNEKLSEEKKRLLYKSKQISSVNGFKFAWISKGDILIKRSEVDSPITIHNERQLNELFPSRLLPEC